MMDKTRSPFAESLMPKARVKNPTGKYLIYVELDGNYTDVYHTAGQIAILLSEKEHMENRKFYVGDNPEYKEDKDE